MNTKGKYGAFGYFAVSIGLLVLIGCMLWLFFIIEISEKVHLDVNAIKESISIPNEEEIIYSSPLLDDDIDVDNLVLCGLGNDEPCSIDAFCTNAFLVSDDEGFVMDEEDNIIFSGLSQMESYSPELRLLWEKYSYYEKTVVELILDAEKGMIAADPVVREQVYADLLGSIISVNQDFLHLHLDIRAEFQKQLNCLGGTTESDMLQIMRD